MTPANVGAENDAGDPRFQPGAYIRDGGDLYWVIGGTLEAGFVTLRAEDCRSGDDVLLDLQLVRHGCELVRAAGAAA